MSDVAAVPDALTHKVGPLPGIAWVGIVAGGAWVFWYWKKHHAGAALPATGGGVDPSLLANSTSAGWSPIANTAGTGGPGTGGTVTTTPGQVSPSTNAQWAAQAANFLVGTGNYGGGDVQTAFDAYLNGNQLNAQQQAIMDSAIHQFGVPPEGVLPVHKAPVAPPVPLKDKYVKFLTFNGDPSLYGITPDGQQVGVTYAQWAALGFPRYEHVNGPSHIPTSTPVYAAAATPGHTYTVQPGDSAVSIAQRFYGTADILKLGGQSITPGNVINIP